MCSERNEKIMRHCFALAKVINAIRPVYNGFPSPQKVLIETMVGAALWYIPKPVSAWTGMISRKALELLHPDTNGSGVRLSEEHVFPRKIAARILLEDTQLDEEKMKELFCAQFGRLHYITPDENKIVTKYQKATVFVSSEQAYQVAGIDLIKVEESDLKAIKKRRRDIIEKYIRAPGSPKV